MRWLAFALFAIVFLGLELGVRGALALGGRAVAPSFVMVLAVFICTSAPSRQALWAALALGVCLDLTNPIEIVDQPRTLTLLGPHALGYVLAAQLTLAMRGLVFRRNPLTIAFLSLLASAVASIVFVAVLTIRSAFDPLDWHATTELFQRFAAALYTGGLALIISPLLLLGLPLLGISGGPSRGRPGRMM